MATRLTQKAVEAAATDKDRAEIADSEVRGLYLVVQRSGAKSWALRFRHDGQPRKLTLGTYPTLSLADAREKAREKRRLVEDDQDPIAVQRAKLAAEREAIRAAEGAKIAAERDRLESVVERFIAEKRKTNRRADDVAAMLKREVVPTLGTRPITAIEASEVETILAGIVERGSPITANRTLVYLRTLFRWHGLRTLDRIKLPATEKERERILTDAEIRWLWRACEEVTPPFGALYRTLLLTGQRLREVAGMTEREIDEAAGKWRIPAARAKNGENHPVPLTATVRAVLGGMQRVDGEAGYAFTTTGKTPVSGFSKAKIALDAAMVKIASKEAGKPVKLEAWRVHDLRRTAASGMARCGVAPHIIERVLNHRSGGGGGSARGLERAYNHYSYDKEKLAALETWNQFVDGIVVSLEKRSA